MQNHSAILWRQVTGALALAGLVWAKGGTEHMIWLFVCDHQRRKAEQLQRRQNVVAMHPIVPVLHSTTKILVSLGPRIGLLVEPHGDSIHRFGLRGCQTVIAHANGP